MTEWMPGEMYRYGKSATVPSSQIDASRPPVHPPVSASLHPSVLASPHINGNDLQHSHKSGSPLSNAISNGTTPFFGEERRISHGNGREISTLNRLAQDTVENHSRIEERPRTGNNLTTESQCEPDVEWVEQDEQGVYITLVALPGGARDLKRVRFR